MQSIMHRLVFVAFVLTLLTTAQAQETFINVNAGLSVVVKEHPTSADMVEVTVVDPAYPKELLQQQILTLGQYINSEPRGLSVGYVQIDPEKPELRFLKANFAVDGLIDRSSQELRVEPILKAFAGAPAPYTLEGLTIIFEGEQTNRNTVRRYDSDAVQAQARVIPAMEKEKGTSIEYGVRYLTQDPAKISFPSRYTEPKSSQATSERGGQLPTYVWIAIFVAGLSAGALVYLALARRSPARR